MGNDLKLFQLTPTPNPSLIREGCMHTTNCRRKRKTAFTLAEVLITLGIIGVVAAMTIPTVITNYKKSQIEARLKKLYTVMNQAVLLSKAHDTWTEPSYEAMNPTDSENGIIQWLQSALIPYLNGAEFPAKYTHPDSNMDGRIKLRFADGTLCSMSAWRQLHTWCDINGTKGPNKKGVDIFYFFLDYNPATKAGANLGYFYPAGYAGWFDEDGEYKDGYVYGDRDKMLQQCKRDESNENTNTSSCALLIMYDGWQIKDDYPIRL